MHDALRRRIEELAASADPAEREVARRLLDARRGHTQAGAGRDGEPPPSRWRNVDLPSLLGTFGNTVQVRGNTLKSGHEPLHGSRSGACLVAWPASGRWWCSSCHRAGDALTYVVSALGIDYGEAARWIEARYGPPSGPARPASIRRRLRRRVFTSEPT